MKKNDFLAALAATGLQMALGFVWYSDSVFGTRWLAAQGKTPPDLTPSTTNQIVLAATAALALSLMIRWLFVRLEISNWAIGARLGTYLGLTLGVTNLWTHYSFLGFPFDLAWIDGGHTLVCCFLSGIVLVVPKKAPQETASKTN